jgi:hypothetical protein
MPAKDTYHGAVRNALTKDGWTITDDPYRLTWGKRDLYVDLGAERFLAAEKKDRFIAIETKSFLNESPVSDLEEAVGQFVVYRSIMEETEPSRELFLAIPSASADILDEPLGQLLLRKHLVQAFSFDPDKEVIVRWFP